MNTTSSYLNDLQELLIRPDRAIVEIVDQLVAICLDHRLQLDWSDNKLQVRQREGNWELIGKTSMRKSALRAILARLATLANECNSKSISPYGGRGEFCIPEQPASTVRFSFVNTASEQKLELTAEQL